MSGRDAPICAPPCAAESVLRLNVNSKVATRTEEITRRTLTRPTRIPRIAVHLYRGCALSSEIESGEKKKAYTSPLGPTEEKRYIKPHFISSGLTLCRRSCYEFRTQRWEEDHSSSTRLFERYGWKQSKKEKSSILRTLRPAADPEARRGLIVRSRNYLPHGWKR
jgi:hypothetical protein